MHQIIKSNTHHFLNTCFSEVNNILLNNIVLIINDRLPVRNKEAWEVERMVKKYLDTWKKTFYSLEYRKFSYSYFKKFVSLMLPPSK